MKRLLLASAIASESSEALAVTMTPQLPAPPYCWHQVVIKGVSLGKILVKDRYLPRYVLRLTKKSIE
jgi:hypothetical protein